MKRLFYLVVIIVLPLLLFFQWKRYRRFNPPTAYSYPLNDSIDPNYHDPEIVLAYYESAEACGTYARYCWREHRVDVRSPDLEDPKEAALVRTYQQMLAKSRHLEQKLIQSATWKDQGYGTEAIQHLEATGLSPDSYHKQRILGEDGLIPYGEESPSVWEVQKLLIAKGYEIRLDGIFDQETLGALNAFQAADSLQITYGVDLEVLEILMK